MIEALDRPAYAMLTASLPPSNHTFVRMFLDHHHL
jgi:hypothetical protein